MKEERKKMTLKARGNSFTFAFSGLRLIFMEEPNVRIHLAATIVVVIAGIFRHISTYQWIAVSVAIAIVWITETLNTCIERLCDLYCNGEYHPAVKIIKDISAGAVLIAALVSVVIGACVFLF